MPKKKPTKQVAPEQEPLTAEGSDFDKWIEENFQDLLTEGIVANSPSELTDGELEALWVKSRGWTPLEFLCHTYRNPWQKTSDRISAAKAVMEYIHQKLPQKVELGGEVVQTKKLKAENLGKLSDKELEVFTKLLQKMEGS